MEDNATLRKVVLIVALANLGYFFIEFISALKMGSVSLFADSIDFLEDAAINCMIFFAIGWSISARAKVGMILAAVILVPGLATIWAIWQKIQDPQPPVPLGLSLVGFGALMINCGCALLLTRFRTHSGSLTRAAFLSARNDAAANIAIILTGFITMFYPSIWPDIIVGLGIALLNADAARAVYKAARMEKDTEALC